jgi:hypothetical protein
MDRDLDPDPDADPSIFIIDLNDRRIRIQETQKHVDKVDPDPVPQHCCEVLLQSFTVSVQELFVLLCSFPILV